MEQAKLLRQIERAITALNSMDWRFDTGEIPVETHVAMNEAANALEEAASYIRENEPEQTPDCSREYLRQFRKTAPDVSIANYWRRFGEPR